MARTKLALTAMLLCGCGGTATTVEEATDEPALDERSLADEAPEGDAEGPETTGAEVAAPSPSAPLSPRDAAASSLEALFAACLDNDLEEAAGHIVYRGDDPTRRWRDRARVADPEEARQVTGICRRIVAALRASSGHEKVRYESGQESEGVWHVWHVRFDTTEGPVEQIFAFLAIDGRYLLGDID